MGSLQATKYPTEDPMVFSDSVTRIFTSINATYSTGVDLLSRGTFVPLNILAACQAHQNNHSDFKEALEVTADVKKQFRDQYTDLIERGDRLIRESISAGVTAMRAHVEVDSAVGDACLKAGLALKAKWAGLCDIQICREHSGPPLDLSLTASTSFHAGCNT